MATKRDGTDLKSLPPVVRDALLKCTPLERRFVMAYCSRAARNGQLAMKLAGSTADYGTRASQATQALTKAEVRAAVEAWMTTYAMGSAEVTAGIADMARCSLEPFLAISEGAVQQPQQKGKKGTRRSKTTAAAPKGTVIVLREQTDESWSRHAHWIKSVEVDPKSGAITKLQVHDPLRALDLMAKILKLYSDAPTVNLFMYLQQLSDDELLAEYEQAVREAGGGQPVSMN